MLIRFWDGDCVTTRFFDSHFLGHACADDVYKPLRTNCNTVGIRGTLQLAMDGPNVNWSIFNKLSKDLEEEIGSKLLNIGSCGLHVMHNAFKAGSTTTSWDIEHTLNCLHWLFKDSPARRDDYTKVTGSAVFPLKYCQHRWLENVTVLERAIEIWPHVQKYVADVKAAKVPHPKNKSFESIENTCSDPMFLVKANVFLSIALELQPFLIKYQTDKLMLPYLADDLFSVLKNLLQRFVTDDVLKRVKTAFL